MTREQLEAKLAETIARIANDVAKESVTKFVGITLRNWYTCGGRREWCKSEIIFGGNHFDFFDKMVSNNDVKNMLQLAIDKCRAVAEIEICDGDIKGVRIFGKPCGEFVKLANYLAKYANYELKQTAIWSTSVCGKRSAWSASNTRKGFLCYQPQVCTSILKFLQSERKSKDYCITCWDKQEFSHGDESDYKYAIAYESEWYGSLAKTLFINVGSPSGKRHVQQKFNAYIN